MQTSGFNNEILEERCPHCKKDIMITFKVKKEIRNITVTKQKV